MTKEKKQTINIILLSSAFKRLKTTAASIINSIRNEIHEEIYVRVSFMYKFLSITAEERKKGKKSFFI